MMRVSFVRAASLTKATKKLVRVSVCACVCVRVCTCVCLRGRGNRRQESWYLMTSSLPDHCIDIKQNLEQNVNWLPFFRVPAACLDGKSTPLLWKYWNCSRFSPRSVLQLFSTLPFYSDRSEKGEERLKKNLFNNSPDHFSIFCHLKRLILADWEIKRKHASTRL